RAQPEEDPRICRTVADAGDGALASHRLRQGVEDRPLRDGQRSHVEGSRVETGLCDRSRIRPRCRSGEDGQALRGWRGESARGLKAGTRERWREQPRLVASVATVAPATTEGGCCDD